MRAKGAAAAAPRPSLEGPGQPQGSVPAASLSALSAGVQRPGRGAGHLRAAPGRFVWLLRAEALPRQPSSFASSSSSCCCRAASRRGVSARARCGHWGTAGEVAGAELRAVKI